jgi:superfamily II DNA or RNA helicase
MGTGKTILGAKHALAITPSGSRVVFLCHLKTLVEQAYEKFREWGVEVQVEQGKNKAKHIMGKPPHVIASKDSLRPDRLRDFLRRTRLDQCTIEVIVDECHLSTSRTFLDPIKGLNPSFLIGLSGTPMRLDGKPLVGSDAPFDVLCCRYDFLNAVRHRNLVPPLFAECRGSIDLRDIKITRQSHGRDYDPQQLRERINANLGHVCNAAKEQMGLWGATRALAFFPDIGVCRAAETMFDRDLGLRCRSIYGDMQDRDHVKRAYHRGDLDVLCSCQMLDVGFDDPPTDGVILATPTKSPVKALQQGGRGSRLFPGKTRYVAIGYRWQTDDEGPQSTLDLLLRGVPDQKVRERAGIILRSRQGVDFLEAVEQAELDQQKSNAEESRRRRDLPVATVDRPADYQLKVYDPLDLASGMVDRETRRALIRCGLEPKEVDALPVADAHQIVGEWLDRTEAGMSTYKQVHRLIAWGWELGQAMALSMKEARSAIYSMVRNRQAR